MNSLIVLALGAVVGIVGTLFSAGLGRNIINIPVGTGGALAGNYLFAGSMGTSNAVGVSVLSAIVMVAVVQAAVNPPRSPSPRKPW